MSDSGVMRYKYEGMLRASVDNVLLADQPADYANIEIIYLVKSYSIKKRIVCFLINDL